MKVIIRVIAENPPNLHNSEDFLYFQTKISVNINLGSSLNPVRVKES